MRRTSALFHQLTTWAKQTCTAPRLGATVTDSGNGYRSAAQGLQSYVDSRAAAVQSCGNWLVFSGPQNFLGPENDEQIRSCPSRCDSHCNADAPCVLQSKATLDPPLTRYRTHSKPCPHLHPLAIARLPSFKTSLSGCRSLFGPSAIDTSGASVKLPLQRSGLYIAQSFSIQKHWGHEHFRSWCNHDGRGYSSAAGHVVQVQHVDDDTITIQSTEHEKWCGACLKVRLLREFRPLRSSPDGVHYWCRGCAANASRARRGLAPGVIDGQAHCPCCDEVKDRALFGLDPRMRSGLQKICRACFADEYQTRPDAKLKSEEGQPKRGARWPVVTLRRKGAVWVPAEKVCTSCGKLKATGEFFSHSRTLDGLRQYCKPCHLKRRSRLRTGEKLKEGEGPDENQGYFQWLVDEVEVPMATALMTSKTVGGIADLAASRKALSIL